MNGAGGGEKKKKLSPDTPIDNALVVWHSDHTALMNSGRPPQDGGTSAWACGRRTDKSKYKLNHFAWGGNDFTLPERPMASLATRVGATHVTETVTFERRWEALFGHIYAGCL